MAQPSSAPGGWQDAGTLRAWLLLRQLTEGLSGVLGYQDLISQWVNWGSRVGRSLCPGRQGRGKAKATGRIRSEAGPRTQASGFWLHRLCVKVKLQGQDGRD